MAPSICTPFAYRPRAGLHRDIPLVIRQPSAEGTQERRGQVFSNNAESNLAFLVLFVTVCCYGSLVLILRYLLN